MADVDWAPFAAYSENTCECRGCGTVFRSHSKYVIEGPSGRIVSRRPCPSCGGDTLRRSSADPEVMTLGRGR